jgi:hypothetical protein
MSQRYEIEKKIPPYDNGKIKIGLYHERHKPLTNVSPDMELLQKALLNIPRYEFFWPAFMDGVYWALSVIAGMSLIFLWLGVGNN